MLKLLQVSLLLSLFLIQLLCHAADRTGVLKLAVLPENRSLNVWYQLPNDMSATTPIVFVMHGVLRNADVYRNNWITLANELNFIVVVPEFEREQFPGARAYNLGNLLAEDGSPNPENLWSFSVIEPVFEAIKQQFNNRSEQFYIFGHSAGSQFVHRLLMFKPELPVAMAIAANAGWYTMPTYAQDFPYGLKGSGARKPDLKKFFGLPMVVLLGDQDIDPKDPNLRTAPEANLQGPHRFARGLNYFAFAKAAAESTGAPFNWLQQTAPGIGHENDRMAPFAARLIKKFIDTGSL